MYYNSTRDNSCRVSGAQAILQGISREAGLFVPGEIPQVSREFLESLCGMSYIDRAVEILSLYLTDFTREELRGCAERAYGGEVFEGGRPAPISVLSPDAYMLELWHGPTCAFKDMALQLLPQLMTEAGKKAGDGRTVVILVATSGDTGKAALKGFEDVPGTRILVFYPEKGVSTIQRLQMATQEGGNVGVAAVEGNFDDCQSRVKEIFTDPAILKTLEAHGMAFSSANSINWGRLAPQIVYYFSAYCDLVAGEEIAMGDKVNVVVPTGNFGNILAACYAKRMGLPLGKLICASNRNNVLTDFIRTGTYDRNRPFYTTTSPSMDILISSNLERYLYDLLGRDDRAVSALMEQLKTEGRYTLNKQQLEQVHEEFWAGCCGDAGTLSRIKTVFETYSYLCDPHTAVALDVYEQYREATGDDAKTIVVSTASPYKFASSVTKALGGSGEGDEFAQLQELWKRSGLAVPPQLAELQDKPVRFTRTFTRDTMEQAVRELLGL